MRTCIRRLCVPVGKNRKACRLLRQSMENSSLWFINSATKEKFKVTNKSVGNYDAMYVHVPEMNPTIKMQLHNNIV